MTTAKHRNKAWDAYEKGDYKTAYKEYGLAIKKYGEVRANQELATADLKNLKERREIARKMIGWKPH